MDKSAGKKADRIALAICFLLALMVWGVFGQTLRYDFVNYDDDQYVYKDPIILKGVTPENIRWAFTHSHVANWHPLTSFSYMLDAQLYGLKPAGYHRTSVLLHMATVILLFLVLRRMTGSLWRSAFATALFAIHPLRVESVAWISERKDVLSGLFFMLTLGAYLRYVRRPFSAGRYATVAIFFTLGLMSKSMLVTLPFVLLLLDFWPLNRFQNLETKKTIGRLVLEKIPLLLLSAVFCGVTVWAQQSALVPAANLSVSYRFGNAFCSYATYIKQLVFPSGLAPLYPHQETGLSLWEIGISAALLAGISWGVFAGRKKHPYLITGWLWYLGMLVPVIGIMQVGSQAHADRYTYLPQIGLVVMASWLAADWCASLRYRRAALSVAAAAALAVLAVAAYGQTRYWRDSFSIWTRTLACTERNYLAQNNLGIVLQKQGKLDEAIEHYEKALEILPASAATYNNLGSAFDEQGKFDEAIEYYGKALEINPGYAEAHSNLGIVFAKQGQIEKAISHLEKALEINPNLAAVHNNLGGLFGQRGQFDKAIPHFEKSLEITPDCAEAYHNLGVAFAWLEKLDEAVAHYEKALEINPDYAEAHSNLGIVFAKQGQIEKAISHLEKALAINPNLAEAHNDLGGLFGRQGQFAKAIPHFEKSLQINPDSTEAHYNLGLAFEGVGKLDAALEHYEKALADNKRSARIHDKMGSILLRQGRSGKALPHFEEVFRTNPDSVEVQNNLAWILATCPDTALRNGKRAVEIARSANRLSGGNQAPVLDTLAAAYAEAGQYPEAVTTARRALDLAAGQESVAEGLRARLRLYEAGIPYHEK